MKLLPIAIPSYHRAHLLHAKTLRYLRRELYPAHLITIFVADEEEAEAYRRATPELLYGQIVVGVKGLAEQRNFISNYYPEGELICQFDDDVSKLVGGKTLAEVLEKGVQWMEEHDADLFSVMPNSDKRRLKDDYTLHLTHCIGAFFVIRNDRSLKMEHSDLEDYERTIKCFLKKGKVIRYRGAGVDTQYMNTTGVLQEGDRIARLRVAAERLGQAYPKACAPIVKNGRPDIKLNWRFVIDDACHS